MKAVAVLLLLALPRLAAGQTPSAPASQPATQPAHLPAARPAPLPAPLPALLPAPGQQTVVGTCRLFDQTAADIGVDATMKFYQCTSNAQRRYARSECEFFVALNRLLRSVKARIGDDAAALARRTLGDNDDYTDVKVDIEGDTATITRSGRKPLALSRIDDEWYFSMPDWFQQQTADDLQSTRLYYESAADLFDALRQQVDAGKFKTGFDLDEQLQKIAATR